MLQGYIGTFHGFKAVASKGISDFFNTFTGQATAAIATFYAMSKAIEYFSDKYNLSYDSAIKNTKEHVDNLNATKSELEDLQSQASQYKDTLLSLGDKYNIDLEGLDTIDELLNKIKGSDTKLELVDQVEVGKIENANNALERQIAIKEKLLQSQQKEAAFDAKDTLNRGKQSVAEKVAQFVPGGKKRYQQDTRNVNVVDAIKEDIAAIETYEQEIENAEKRQKKLTPESSSWKKAEKDIKAYNEAINELTSDIDTKEADLNALLSAFSENGEGLKALDGFEDEFKEVKSAFEALNNMNLRPAERALNDLNSYFDGSSGNNFIKDLLTDAAKSGGDLEAVLSDLGLSLSDIGSNVDSDALNRYFQDIIKSANEASEAVNKVNNNLTMEDIGEAFESKNAGDDYVSLNDYLKKAKDLYDKGLVGTDDFKSVAEAISYNVDTSAESFKANYDKLQRYFIEDKDGNLTGEGIHNFLSDLQDLNKGYATWNNEAGKWDINMDNTAQAAKDLGVSVQVMEAVLGRIKDYDGIGDFDFHSAIKDFETAKESIEGLRSVYEEMQDSPKKEALGDKLTGWESQLDTWENDLATLDTDVVMNIKLEYDLATIQQQIDEVQALIDSGENTVGNNAQVIAGNQKYINTAEEGLGFNMDGVKVPVEYEVNENTIDYLRGQLKKVTSDEDKVQIQAEIENLQDIQKQLLDSFSTAHPEINADSSVDEINAAWDSFISSTEGQEIVANITANDEEAKEKVAELLGIEPEDITIDVKANDEASDTITSVLSQLMGMPEEKVSELIAEDNASDAVIKFLSSISDIPEEKLTSINATDGASGVVTYVLSQILGLPEEKISNLLATDNASNIASMAKASINTVPELRKSNITATDNASSKARDAKSAINDVKSRHVTISGSISGAFSAAVQKAKSMIASLGGGKAGLNGTAHIDGTVKGLYPIPKLSGRALAMGTIEDDSWLKPRWKTKKTDVALTGEVGQEMVVKGNRWWTVGDNGAEFSAIPQGAVVFNAKQTKELLKKGFTNSRGIAHLSGTAYAGGASGSFSFGGGASKYNGKSSYSSKVNTKKTTSSANRATNAVSSAADATKDALDALTNYFDWVEVNMKRAARLSEIAENAIDNAIGLSAKQANTEEAIRNVQSEIEIARQGADKYLSHANWFAGQSGLSVDLQNRVQNGTIDISKYDDDTQKKIKEYQDWWIHANVKSI